MLRNKKSIAFIIVGILLIINSVIVYNIFKDDKQIKFAKNFKETLERIQAIPTIGDEELSTLKVSRNKKSPTKYTVISNRFGIDLDKKYSVIGFSMKNGQTGRSNEEIDEEDAIKLAEEYLGHIISENFKFKELRKIHTDDNNYDIVFYKYYEGYPYYNLEISLKIDKYNGMLTGYSNINPYGLEYHNEKKIDETKAKECVDEYCSKLKISYTEIEKPNLYYVTISDEDAILAYEFKVEILEEESNEKRKSNILVNAKNGEIVTLKENIDDLKEN